MLHHLKPSVQQIPVAFLTSWNRNGKPVCPGLLKFERHDELFAKGYEDAKPAIEEWLAAQDRPR